MKNKNLHQAKRAKNDEFYTQLSDIEKELRHYKKHFQDKVVYCNCDDPFESNFFKYFAMNFNHLGLKRLITTSYNKGGKGQKIVIDNVEDVNGDGAVDMGDVVQLLNQQTTDLEGDGDFRSVECIELLRQSDIICTNPPFSLFREYVAQLVEHDKKFLIVGNKNAITYKEIFKLIKENRVWLGHNSPHEFRTPTKAGKPPGQTIQKFGNVGWFTSIDTPKRHEKLELYRKYTPEEYPKYDNYDAIEVSKVVNIPKDYDGIMGVPITFLDKYNPLQFEIAGCSYNYGRPSGWDPKIQMNGSINGWKIYKRLLIRKR